MANYLIKTDKESQRTFIFDMAKKQQLIGSVYTDFDLLRTKKEIRKEDIVDSNLKPIAQIEIFTGDDIIRISKYFKEISSLNQNWKYKENSNIISFNKHNIEQLKDPSLESLKNQGLVNLYTFPKTSVLQQVACFEQNGDLAGLVQGRNGDSGLEVALAGFPFVVGKRVELQEYIYALR